MKVKLTPLTHQTMAIKTQILK